MFIRAGDNYDFAKVSFETGLDTSLDQDTGEELTSMTQQSFAAESDINEIVRRFGLTGVLPETFRAPREGDFTDVMDYHSALNAVLAADEEFMSMPAELRARFENDPQQLLDFVSKEANREEAIKLGLIPRPPEKTRDAVQAIDELAAKMTAK